MALVYKITNLINGKFYIGITIQGMKRRWAVHVCYANSDKKKYMNYPLVLAMRKYGIDMFRMSLLKDGLTREEAMSEERRLIAALNPDYNATSGGEHAVPTAATRAKMSASNRGKKRTKEFCQKISDRMRAPEMRAMSAKHAVVAREALKLKVICLNDGREFDCARDADRHYGLPKCAVNNICRGWPLSCHGYVFRYLPWSGDSEKELRDILARRHTFSQERRDNISRANLSSYAERMMAPDWREKWNNTHRVRVAKMCRRVMCIDTGQIFESTVAAAKYFGANQGNLHRAAREGRRCAGRRFTFDIKDGL